MMLPACLFKVFLQLQSLCLGWVLSNGSGSSVVLVLRLPKGPSPDLFRFASCGNNHCFFEVINIVSTKMAIGISFIIVCCQTYIDLKCSILWNLY